MRHHRLRRITNARTGPYRFALSDETILAQGPACGCTWRHPEVLLLHLDGDYLCIGNVDTLPNGSSGAAKRLSFGKAEINGNIDRWTIAATSPRTEDSLRASDAPSLGACIARPLDLTTVDSGRITRKMVRSDAMSAIYRCRCAAQRQVRCACPFACDFDDRVAPTGTRNVASCSSSLES